MQFSQTVIQDEARRHRGITSLHFVGIFQLCVHKLIIIQCNTCITKYNILHKQKYSESFL